MMNQEKEQERPFPDVLDALFTDEQVDIALLYRLSDVSESELAQFAQQWPTVDPERRRVIVRHLADISEENFVVDFTEVFAHGLRDSHAPVQVAALDGIWDSDNTALIPAIIDLLPPPQPVEVQTAAARALAHYVLMAEWGELPQRIQPPIVEALLTVYDAPATAVSVRRAALEALGAAAHPRVPHLITTAYDSGEHGMQVSALFAMGSSADPRWLSTVMAEMESPYPEMRAEAARAAGAIGRSDPIDLLDELVIDDADEVRTAAIVALGQIGGDRAYEILARLLEDDRYEPYFDLIEESLEESMWLSGEMSLLSMDGEDDEDDDEFGISTDHLPYS